MSRSARVAAAVLTLLACALPASAAHAASWMPGPSFGNGTIDGIGNVAVAESGAATAAWIEPSTMVRDVTNVLVQRVAADGSRGPAIVLGEADAGSEAHVDVTPSGLATVVWVSGGTAIKLVSIAPDGTVGPVREVAVVANLRTEEIVAATDDAGNATVAWTTNQSPLLPLLSARRITAAGSRSPIVDVETTDWSSQTQLAVAPDGIARLVWVVNPDSGPLKTVRAARLNAAGSLDGGPVSISSTGADASVPTVDASAGGAVATWIEVDGTTVSVRGMRLPAAGGLAGTLLTVATGEEDSGPWPASVIAADGTVTAAWSQQSSGGMSRRMFTRTLRPDGTAGAVKSFPGELPDGTIEAMPTLATAPGGSVFMAWARGEMFSDTADVMSARIAPDGTTGPATVLGPIASTLLAPGRAFAVAVDGSGSALVGWHAGATPRQTLSTAVYDDLPPAVEATIPASVEVGRDAAFSATATDRSGVVSLGWDFGDESTSAKASTVHVYGRAGTYTVTLSVIDRAGNATVVNRALTVTAAPGPGPDPRVDPAPGKAASRLKLSRVVRKGRALTVSGTLDRRASGKVMLAYAQKIGRRTVAVKATAKIVKGRYAARLRLSAALARMSRGKATLTVSYAGDADTRPGRVRRTIKPPRRSAASLRTSQRIEPAS